MAYWLVKSEPSAWSWSDHFKVRVAEWDGVCNHQANNNMKAMKGGDLAFFYHSVTEKSIVCFNLKYVDPDLYQSGTRSHSNKQKLFAGRILLKLN